MVTITWGRSPPVAGRPIVLSCFTGPNEPLEEPLGPGAPVSNLGAFDTGAFTSIARSVCSGRDAGSRATGHPNISTVARVAADGAIAAGGGIVVDSGIADRRRGADARVGSGVHDRQEVFVLVSRGEDFQVVQPAADGAQEGTLALAGFVVGRFGAILVDGVGPVAGDASQEIGVVFGGGAGEGMFHPQGRVCNGVVADAVQGDDGGGAGGYGSGGKGLSEFRPFRRLGVAGDSGAGQDCGGEGEPAPGFGDADPEQGAEELRGGPVSVHRPDLGWRSLGCRRPGTACFRLQRPC